MVRVVSIDRFYGKGVTHPCVARIDDGEPFTAFIKLIDNPEGTRCLINELVSYRLAVAVGVLMPESGVAIVDSNTVDNTGCNLKESSYGPCFYSRQIEKALQLNAEVMRFVDNKEMYEKVIMFDHLIYNTDRNLGNLLLTAKKREKALYAIDHTHVFKNQAIWDSNCLELGIKEKDYLSRDILNCNEMVYGYFAQDKAITASSLRPIVEDFKRVCNEKVVEEALNNLPKEWFINNTDLETLEEYLLYRANHLNDMCEMIVKEKGWKND